MSYSLISALDHISLLSIGIKTMLFILVLKLIFVGIITYSLIVSVKRHRPLVYSYYKKEITMQIILFIIYFSYEIWAMFVETNQIKTLSKC
jgi:hypothetical protein